MVYYYDSLTLILPPLASLAYDLSRLSERFWSREFKSKLLDLFGYYQKAHCGFKLNKSRFFSGYTN